MNKSIIFLCFFLFLFPLWGNATEIIPDTPIRVGVYVSPPYVIRENDGQYTGFAIDIFNKAINSSKTDASIIYKEYNNIGDLLHSIDEMDIAVSGISFTPERSKKLDFSQPFDEGGLGVLIKPKNSIGLYSVTVYLYISIGLICSGIILMLIDRHYNPKFTRSWILGFSESMYHVVAVLIRGNSSHEPIFRPAIQYWLSILWMFCGSALLSFIMVTYMGFLKGGEKIKSLEELAGTRIAVQYGSTADDFISEMGFLNTKYEKLEDAISLLVNSDVDAIVADKSVLMYYSRQKKGMKLELLDELQINKELYGFAFPLNSGLRKIIDEKILQYINSGKIDEIKEHYGVTD